MHSASALAVSSLEVRAAKSSTLEKSVCLPVYLLKLFKTRLYLVHISISTSVYIHTYTYIHIYIYTYIHIYIYAYIYIYTYAYTYMYNNTHTHIQFLCELEWRNVIAMLPLWSVDPFALGLTSHGSCLRGGYRTLYLNSKDERQNTGKEHTKQTNP